MTALWLAECATKAEVALRYVIYWMFGMFSISLFVSVFFYELGKRDEKGGKG